MTEPARSFEPVGERMESSEERAARKQTLYEAHVDYVWTALQRLGVAWDDLEDLTHEVFLRVFHGWERLDPARPARLWLVGIAHHVAIDYLRRQQHPAAATEALAERASAQPNPEEAFEVGEARRIVGEILAAMDLDRRTILILHELLGHTAPEIAEALEIPLNTAYSRLRLARRDFERLAVLRGDRP